MKDDAYERRALLLHLGDVLEALSCLSRSGAPHATLGEALVAEDSLVSFTWLGFIDSAMSPRTVSDRAASAFFLWPKSLLDENLNRPLLASTVQHDLFAGNPQGWSRYVAERRKDVAWFAEGLKAPPAEGEPEPEASEASGLTRWPWPEKT
ncbi:hypothetical protein [Caballeronia sordidicola]|uniref:Uncharacterized protein n=1 Tax=Caballeronia sordidicola TaxID=196367 RepID=A0A242N154_CABSO|nr:hypothetical protein [Caballeronia sordidicola]OTP77395.1 hypothetical protein PAMC26510_09380 [Caballeronia sordidicola]